MHSDNSLSEAFVKHISYFSEEYIKQLIMEVDSGKVATLKPFVGSLSYPSSLFPSVGSAVPTTQFAATTYIGLMQMIFPEETSTLEDLPAYTVLQIDLDGVERTFVTIAGGDITAGVGGTKFIDFVNSLYPTANDPLPFNETAIHVLRNIRISGSKFTISGSTFVASGFVSNSHTKDYSFCISVSGYSAIIL